jgi:hypothetical protein
MTVKFYRPGHEVEPRGLSFGEELTEKEAKSKGDGMSELRNMCLHEKLDTTFGRRSLPSILTSGIGVLIGPISSQRDQIPRF